MDRVESDTRLPRSSHGVLMRDIDSGYREFVPALISEVD